MMDMPITYCKVCMDWAHRVFIYIFLWESYTEMLGMLDLRVMSLANIATYANSVIWKLRRDGHIQSPADVHIVIHFIKCEYRRQFHTKRKSLLEGKHSFFDSQAYTCISKIIFAYLIYHLLLSSHC